MLCILDYGLANLRSVQKAFEQVGCAAAIISTPREIEIADQLVLPGVGAIGDALANIRRNQLDGPIIDHIRRGRPFLGICLGLQMLFDVGYEDGEHRALEIYRGECVRLTVDAPPANLKVPHMGWNALEFKSSSPLLRDLDDGASVYFVHSYHVVPADASIIATTTDYGGDFVSSVWKDNVVATQFHPEKSQRVGLKMLENFTKL
jgi:glutamine amidotransferase